MPFRKPKPTLDYRMENGLAALTIQSDGCILLEQGGEKIRRFHAYAKVSDGRKADTRTAKRISIEEVCQATPFGAGKTLEIVYEENGLLLKRSLTLPDGKAELIASVSVKDTTKCTESNELSPLDAVYPDSDEKTLFRSLDQRMLLAPYDNDMWVRWETTPLRPGRTSYDISALYDKKTREGLILGALDHDVWKNGIRCSKVDARCVICVSGIADDGTHDFQPHGSLVGEWVTSSRFLTGWFADIRDGLETYASYCAMKRPAIEWDAPVPFGWNSYSGVGHTTLECWDAAGDVLEELPVFRDTDGVNYVNLDATFGLDSEKRKAIVKKFHARGQKCGTYGGPFLYHSFRDMDTIVPGTENVKMSDMRLRLNDGSLVPPIDGLCALDCTHPAWEGYIRNFIQGVAAEGFDYLKIDFLAHASIEAKFCDPEVRTGRQAYTRGMRIIVDELKKAEQPIFLSLSIAPLFPYGYGHARRCCCDSFGHYDDVRYVLNALTFAWWTNRTLYALNDPDHIALYNSVIDGRGTTTLREARSRYNSAVISGTVMLLSDNFGPDCSDELRDNSIARVKQITANDKINAIARSKVAFRPVELDKEASEVYTAVIDGKTYVAFFNFSKEPKLITLDTLRGNIAPKGKALDLNRDICWDYEGSLSVALEPTDSAIIELQ